MMEEQYNSLQEETEAKTKKLKKVWAKVKENQVEIKLLQDGFDKEREDLLDTIRDLTGQLKLKNLLLKYFVPTQVQEFLETNATWNETADAWGIRHAEVAGNT